MNSNNDDSLKLFLNHYVTLIKEQLDSIVSSEKPVSEFESGRKLAYYEVADLILECSRLFNVPLSGLGIENFDPNNYI